MPAKEATSATSPSSESEERHGYSDTMVNSNHNIKIYIITSLAVLEAYLLLLRISISYIKLVIIPIIMLFFIGALCAKSWVKGILQYESNSRTELSNGVEKTNMLEDMVKATFILQGIVSDIAATGPQNDSFVISHFLLFFSSALGALAVMMATLPVGISLGVPTVCQVLHMTFNIVLFMTLHTKATEWIGEDMVLVCMPELIAVLVWFTTHFDNGGCTLRLDKVLSRKSSVIILSTAMTLLSFLTSMFAYERNVLAKWYTRALASCSLSGIMSYFSVWIVYQWPGSTDSVKVPIQLLKFSANICFGISAILVLVLLPVKFCVYESLVRSSTAAVILVGRWVFDEPTNILDIVAICSAFYILFLYRSILYAVFISVKFRANRSSDKLVLKFLCYFLLRFLSLYMVEVIYTW